MTKAAAYLRVSTEDQTTDNQLPAIKAWCESRGVELVEVYQEAESAWRNGHQWELSRLMLDLKSGRKHYDYVMVWALDRLTRQGITTIMQMVNQFKLCRCQVVSIQEPWTEQSGPMGDLLYAITRWAAEFESKRRSERTLAGLDRARANGKTLGRPQGTKDKGKRKRTGYLMRYAGAGN